MGRDMRGGGGGGGWWRGAPKLHANKGKPIPPGLVVILETQGSADTGSMGVSRESGQEEGGRRRDARGAGYCPRKKVCHGVSKLLPESCEDPVTCSVQMFSF